LFIPAGYENVFAEALQHICQVVALLLAMPFYDAFILAHANASAPCQHQPK
jgi:hypothetical protein